VVTEAEGQAPYERIADHYRAEIESGRLKPGEKLPTVTDLSKKWSVSKGTINHAIAELRSEGLVQTAGRGGTKVRERLDEVESVLMVELTPDIDVTATEIRKISGVAARQLEIADGGSVLLIRLRRRGSGDVA
jgi:DNA-binding GntR family transcriptional regulator